MLEDMDKKASNRSVQGPLKGNGTEPKKQDVPPNTKQYPKWRKREPFSSNGTKFEQGKKPPMQKAKSYDKRPRPRGNYSGSRKEETQIEEHLEDELGLAFGEGKQRSLNHLLNFHYERREQHVVSQQRPQLQPHTTKALMATKTHKYNKEHFLQANCQFVVRSGGDYAPYLGDPDLLVDWQLIELIRVSSSEEVSCPICLYPPVAAKITRCGHIYCWSCILHYLALSDKSWRKCPICYEAVHKSNLKSVECIERPFYSVGQKIKLQLMKREKGTLIASPVEQHQYRLTKPLLSLSELTLDTSYSKLLLANTDDIQKIINKERLELETQLKEFQGTPELCFVEEAMDLLRQRATSLKGMDSKSEEVTDSCDQGSEETERLRLLSSSSEADSENISLADLDIASTTTSQATKHFFFYQGLGGDKVFLHALNVRMLEMEYGSLEQCPPIIEGTIVEIESGSMTSELRNRLRYLHHLPVTCQFEVVEISLGPPVLHHTVLSHFQDQVEMRRRKRAKRARDEKRRSRVIDDIERRMLGQGMKVPNLKIESHFHFPECGGSGAAVAVEDQSRSPSRSDCSSRCASPVREESSLSSAISSLCLEPQADNSNPSFAEMLREGSCGVLKRGWPPIENQSRGQKQPSFSGCDSDPDLAAFSPPARPMFTIADALKMAAASQKKTMSDDSGQKKKKKKKQKVLFTTGMACGGGV